MFLKQTIITATILLSVAMPMTVSAEAWTVSRLVPPPTEGSQELYDAVNATPKPPVTKELPSTVQGWIDMSVEGSAAFAVMGKGVAAQWKVNVEKAEIAGVPVYWVTPSEILPENENRLFVHTHGGGFSMGFGDAAPFEALSISHYGKIRSISIDYSTIPLHPFPTALDEIVAVYKELLKDYDPASMAIGGSSAGGNLSMATIHKLKMDGIATPAAYFGGTPWTDIAKLGDSYFTNEGIDRILPFYEGDLAQQAVMYADGKDMKNPLISPVYGDFSTFPPAQLVSGTRDLLLSTTIRAHRAIRAAGGIADLNVYDGISHGEFLVYTHLPENKTVYTELGEFLRKHLK